MEVKIIRSARKSVAIEIDRDANVIVRAPRFYPKEKIESLLSEKREWIEKGVLKMKNAVAKRKETDGGDIEGLTKEAYEYLPKRVRELSERVGVDYGKITVRHQKTRWGSCTSEGNLSFNCMLMKTPKDVIDYVIIHELCHRKEMNHSKNFWAEVERAMPEYEKMRKWLKENGGSLI